MAGKDTGFRVLLVEDNPAHADLIGEILTDFAEPAFHVAHTPTLSSALAHLRDNEADAVLVDLHLPDSRGIGTLSAVHEVAPGVAIIVLTGLGDEETGLEAVRLGAQDYLVKTEMSSQLLIRAVRYGIERKRSEEAFRALADELVQTQKLEAVGRLASGIAHEFNNVLMGVSGCSKVALGQLDRDHPAYRFVAGAHEAALKGKKITDQFMELSRKREVIERVKLDQVIRRLQPVLAGMLGSGIDIVIDADSGGAEVNCVAHDLQQLVRNLATNAGQAMAAGGTLTLRTCEVTLSADEARRHVALRAARYVVLEVRDTGTGMGNDTRVHAFEPFFTRREVGQGTGLGLTMSYAIATRYGGHLEIDSEPSRGTKVSVYFPMVVAERSLTDDPALATVLLVEDEPMVRVSVRHFLEHGGYRVLEASSGREAIDLCRNNPGVDMLLTDMMLPEMPGNEIADEVGRLHPELRVLFMSAHPREQLQADGHLRPGESSLEKPFTEDALLARVGEVLGQSPGQPRAS